MKKLNYLLIGLAGLTMASCSQEDVVAPGGGDGVLVTVNLPSDLGTRAMGDATASTVLNYAIYTTEGQFIQSGTENFPAGATKTQFTLQLAGGTEYQIAFFAQSQQSITDGVYSFKPDPGTVEIDYSQMTNGANNADAYDCFSILETIPTVTPGMSIEATLERPVAQINWGTNDLGLNSVETVYGENGANIHTVVTTKAYPSFDLLTQNLTDDTEPVDVTFLNFTPPTTEQAEFPVGGYSYVAVNYLLVPQEASVLDLKLSIYNSEPASAEATPLQTVTVNSAPVENNYRTNIYGALLTNNVDVTVEKDPTWGGEHNFVWDGQTVTIPTIVTDSEGNKSITIASNQPDVLAGLAAMVNGGQDLSDVTVTLTGDLDMGGYSFPGIGNATRSSGNVGAGANSFRGTFDGQGKTISGLNIKYTGSNGNTAAAFIPNLDGEGTLKDVNFENVTINGGLAEQAGIVGLVTGGATVSGVTVGSADANENSSITATEGAGGIVGRILGSGTVTGCVNYANVTQTGNNNAGGIVGTATYRIEGNTMTISNCNNYGTISGSGTSLGGIVGTSSADITNCNNYGEVKGTKSSIGGISGILCSPGYITESTNYATISGGPETGGIVGMATYYGNYEAKVVSVTNCTNNGDIIGGGAAGIVGRWNSSGTCTGNKNFAKTITGTSVAAGIIAGAYSGNNALNVGDGKVNVANCQTSKSCVLTAPKTAIFVYIPNGTYDYNDGGNNDEVDAPNN